MIFEKMQEEGFEQIVYCYDEESNLQGIIAIHDTTLGPALGGTRMWNYHSEAEALEDVLRLAKGMTYKNAAAGLQLGGGKAVIIGNAKTDKSEAMFRAFGKYVERLNGTYITAVDVGTSVADMDHIFKETKYVCGTSTGGQGNPSPITGLGIYKGMKAASQAAFGTDSLKDRTVAVQGLGQVAYTLCEKLHEEGASLIVTDIDEQAIDKVVNDFGARAVQPNEIYGVDCDIFAPCALGGIINDETIAQLQAKVIAGSANNQLLEEKHGDILHDKNIIYAPDYVINSGGVINVADELEGYNKERVLQKVDNIYNILLNVFKKSKEENIPTYKAANKIAEEKIEAAKMKR